MSSRIPASFAFGLVVAGCGPTLLPIGDSGPAPRDDGGAVVIEDGAIPRDDARILADAAVRDASSIDPCGDTRFLTERFDDAAIQVIDDAAVTTGGSTLDLYVPDPSLDACGPRPLIVFVHGGGWVVGQKEWMGGLARYFARHGILAATIDYRKTTSGELCTGDVLPRSFYRAAQDVHAAVQWIVARGEDLDLDPEGIFFRGNSAGAITTLALVMATQSELDASMSSITAFEGPLTQVSMHPSVTYRARGAQEQAGALFDSAWMTRTTGERAPALMLMHSEGDASVPYDVDGTAVCASLDVEWYGSGWIGGEVARDPSLVECLALYRVDGDVHDLDEVYGSQQCSTTAPPCPATRMDVAGLSFIASVMAGRCETQRWRCSTSACTPTGAAVAEPISLFP